MAIAAPKVVAPATAGTGATTIYTVTAGKTAVVGTVSLCNTDTVSRDVNMYFVPSGGSVGAANQVLKMTLPPGATQKDHWGHCLAAGDTVQVSCPTAAGVVGVRVSAVEG